MGSFIGWATARLVRRNTIEREKEDGEGMQIDVENRPIGPQGVAKLRIEAETQEEIAPRVLS